MKDIAIYGAGGFGKEVACIVRLINEASEEPRWNFIGYFDDGIPPTDDYLYGPIIGGMEKLNSWETPLDVVIAICSPRITEKIVNGITNQNLDFPNIIAPDVVYLDPDSVTLGKGNIICTNNFLSYELNIGNFNQFNNNMSIGHELTVGDFNSFMPGVRVSGNVTFGDRNFCGLNSCIVQNKQIGNDVVIGACALLMHNPENGYMYIGIPAQKVEK
ncbi:MAG: serine acetyltransferase [Bacteroidaceae bacterium]|nr:serine acetyltransferase [Bacteroidaceae bacterium]